MSSLSQQLQQIGEKNASVALDRKTRSKIHSRSLIFDAKTAATQDYDYLYQVGVEGLDDLIDLDSRFAVFKGSLFSETSLTFDRDLQTKEMVAQLNSNIEAFFNLLGPLYQLAPSLKAAEWLVRRFYANIHNAEIFLLSVLPHYQTPVFVKILNVIPESSFPKIFSWVLGYKKLLKSPPSTSVLKSFYNDAQFYKLYSNYLLDQLANKSIYNQQLVFYLANTVQVLASYSRDLAKLNDNYLPVVLEVVGKLLLPADGRISKNSTIHDIKLTAYTIVGVLGSITPLTSQLIVLFTESILKDPRALDSSIIRQTLIVLGQIWNFQNDDMSTSFACFGNLKPSHLDDDLLSKLKQEGCNLNKFLTFYLLSESEDSSVFKIFKHIDLNESIVKAITNKALGVISSKKDDLTRDSIINVFERTIKFDKDLLVEALKQHNKTISDLEMILMHSLLEHDNDADVELEDDHDTDDVEPSTLQNKALATYKTSTKSFFTAETEEFDSLVKVLLDTVVDTEDMVQAATEFSNTIFENNQVAVSFFVRVAVTSSFPLAVRTLSLKVVAQNLRDKEYAYYLLVPVLLLGLHDDSKSIRAAFVKLLKTIQKNWTNSTNLFLEDQIYGSLAASERAIIAPKDAKVMLRELTSTSAANIDDTILDRNRLVVVLYEHLFKSTAHGKKFGPLLLKTFVLNQWSLSSWPLVLKSRAWLVAADHNKNGSKVRLFFEKDVTQYLDNRESLSRQAIAYKLDLKAVERSVVQLVGGHFDKHDKKSSREVDWLLQAVASPIPSLQEAANERIVNLFGLLRSTEQKLRITSELIEQLVNDADVAIDPLDTLQAFSFDHDTIVGLLQSVQIVSKIPEQGVAKRRRRSSNSTKQNMAKDEISNMASAHLKKLTIILDILEYNLRNKPNNIAQPDLLQALFKILTDLDYLGNDGNLPVLYAQESLASCLLLGIVDMKKAGKKYLFDSNSVRADLIVNSIRLSPSPQVQNRLLLVIAELASLAPEIILHSVMPIFTFMGAHTVRQDDEFSSSALQQTIAKVIPALAKSGSSLSNEIEFLLISFVTAFQHIPRHRRVKLFISLSKTLGYKKSLHIVVFLIGQQYAQALSKAKHTDCNSLLEFSSALLQNFEPLEVLESLGGFLELWDQIPDLAVEQGSDQYNALSGRSIFGTSLVSKSTDELVELKAQLLRYVHLVLSTGEQTHSTTSLRVNVALVLLDPVVPDHTKRAILSGFNNVTSTLLSSLEAYTNSSESHDTILDNLYKLLSSLLNLLPLSHFVDSILPTMKKTSSPLSIRVARNFVVLAGVKFEAELNSNNIDDEVEASVLNKFLPVLINGVNSIDNTELVQSYLDTFAVIVYKFGTSTSDFTKTENANVLINALKNITTAKGLLNEQVEVVISSIHAISSVVTVLGVKTIGLFPKIFGPALKIWEKTLADEDDDDANKLIQGAVIALISCFVKKLPAFLTSSLEKVLEVIFYSDLVDHNIRSSVVDLLVEHVDLSQLLKSLCNLALTGQFYTKANAGNLALYLGALSSTIEKLDKKSASSQGSLFLRWLIKSFEFRGESSFNDNTINRLESSFHSCGIAFVMKLNDKSFRPLFASLVRWTVDNEGAFSSNNTERTRYLAFFKFFNKLQESLRGIVTSYFSYALDATAALLTRFAEDKLTDTNLRRIVLNSLTSSFKYDQEDYWSQLTRFESIVDPLLGQLANIEDSIGKYLVKAITTFVVNVSAEEYNEKLVHGLIKHISNENDPSSNTKIWALRTLKAIFQKMGEQWLSYLPTLIPYIAELLEDDDEEVELEVRSGLVRVVESVLGEPLDRYLN